MRGPLVLLPVAVLILVGLLPALGPVAAAATFTLHGSAGGGWGATPGTITSPGPTLTVNQGESTTLNLFAADGFPHSWCIDYDTDGACALTGENDSGIFSAPSVPHVFTFVPTGAPALYQYICGVHGALVMRGSFEIRASARPVVTITSPSGSQNWTGGSVHPIVWSMSDPQDANPTLTVYVNYTVGASSFPIAGPLSGTGNPNSVPWTVPLLNSTSVSVNVTAIDPAGNRGWAVASVPAIDASPPAVVDLIPSNGSTGIPIATNVVVTFNDAMNRAATADPAAVALQDLTTLAWIPVTYSWNPGSTVLTMDPASDLQPTRMYRASVNASALDASDPGNNVSSAAASSFETGTGADLTPPTITNVAAVPDIQEYGFPVQVSADVADDDAVASVFLNVSFPDATSTSQLMSFISGTTWRRSQAFPLLGTYGFRVAAVDASGNWNESASAPFVIEDTTAPSLTVPSVAPSPAELYGDVTIRVNVSDPFLASVRVAVSGVLDEPMDLDPVVGDWTKTFVPTAETTYTFIVAATDTSGNSGTRSGSVVGQDTTTPPAPTGIGAAVVLGGLGIEVTWTGVAAPDLAGYRVYRSTSPTGPFTTPIGPLLGTTAFTDTTVSPATRYYYVVTAVDLRDHESAQSPAASAETPPPPGPDLTVVGIAAVGISAVVVAALALLLWRRRKKGA